MLLVISEVAVTSASASSQSAGCLSRKMVIAIAHHHTFATLEYISLQSLRVFQSFDSTFPNQDILKCIIPYTLVGKITHLSSVIGEVKLL